uniref:C2H2-type domain-containing protein n=1 Tax=Rhabditophanes sp. KR3021 TaxID=114890 RepID=A0AC35U1I0_9BILA
MTSPTSSPPFQPDYQGMYSRAVGSTSEGFHLTQSYLTTGVNGMSITDLKCVDCNIAKTTTEDLEIHIKTEHLNFLPFKCPLCGAVRASDNQMREHVHSTHRQHISTFHYQDNDKAKRILQLMMDKSLFKAAGLIHLPPQPKTDKKCNLNSLLIKKMGKAIHSEDPNLNAMLNGDLSAFLNGKSNKSTDGEEMESVSSKAEESELTLNDITTTLFESNGLNFELSRLEDSTSRHKMLSKKKVLGLCSRCSKKITAGSRMMHIYHHLFKDEGQCRFRCKYTDCSVEYYRKDQMESHQSKVHGSFSLEMMEDRSQELFERCQSLSMELLGTINNTPGPTADHAILSNAAALTKHTPSNGTTKRPKKRRHEESEDDELPTLLSAPFDTTLTTNFVNSLKGSKCNLCYQSVIDKGAHVVKHVCEHLSVARYSCKYCKFGSETVREVEDHGIEDHEERNVGVDVGVKYEKEIKEIYKKCFGHDMPTNGALLPLDEDKEFLKKLRASTFDEESEDGKDQSKSHCSRSARSKKSSHNRKFGTRRPSTREKKVHMTQLREISMKLGGAVYFKKRNNDALICQVCEKVVASRISDHGYLHLKHHLFSCPYCKFGHVSRKTMANHMKGEHNSSDQPTDNRLRFGQEIKNIIKKCFPQNFVDAPIPTVADIKRLLASLNMMNQTFISGVDNEEESTDKDEHDYEDEQESQKDVKEDATDESDDHHSIQQTHHHQPQTTQDDDHGQTDLSIMSAESSEGEESD